MPTADNDREDILTAWENFLSGQPYGDGLRPQIEESWRRCRQNSVDPYTRTSHRRLDDAAFKNLLAEKDDLITIAKPFMSNLYEFVRGSGFVVVLTDETGYVMELFGDANALTDPLTSSFFRGSSWQETECGTNAIGTAAVIKSPIQISGAEHFCRKHHGLTCSAAPILDNRRQIIGILNISGPSHMAHLHTLGMVVSTAAAIMAQLDIRLKNRELAFSNSRLTNIFNTISDGVLLVDHQGIINELNPVAREILSGAGTDVLGMPIATIFGSKAELAQKLLYHKERYEDVELIVDTKKATLHCYTSGEPLTDEQGKGHRRRHHSAPDQTDSESDQSRQRLYCNLAI